MISSSFNNYSKLFDSKGTIHNVIDSCNYKFACLKHSGGVTINSSCNIEQLKEVQI
jgi:hypothetical protein